MREALIRIDETDFAALGIEELVATARAAGIAEFDELACHGDSSVIKVGVEAPMDEAVLEDLAYVHDWDPVVDVREVLEDGLDWDRVADGETAVYVISFVAPGVSGDVADASGDLVGTCDPSVDDRGASMTLTGPQDAIAGAVDGYEADGASPELRRLGGYRGDGRPLEALTRRQREVVETAYEQGFYEVPRAASTEAVADELDLDPSTVAEHLQRAERNLMAHHLEDA
jgi:DNA-binding CsgD family transcriptional regulator